MKKFKHTWGNEIFLLHIELNTQGELSSNKVECMRKLNDSFIQETIKLPNQSSHRFIISRSKPNEEELILKYSDEVVMEVFFIDDRAYYPTKSFFKR
ncbi:hypothetical protein [Phascolarctobacterium sp.]